MAQSGGTAGPHGRRCLRGACRTPRSLPVFSAGCECPHGDSSCGAVRGAHRDPPRRRGREQASAPSPALGAHFTSARGVGRARGAEAVHLRTRLRSVQRPQKVEAGLVWGRRLLCRVRSVKARARVPSWGARLPPSLCPRRRARVMRRSQTTRPSSRPCACPLLRAPVPSSRPCACPRRLWRVPSCLRLRLAGERAWRFPVRAAAVTVTPGSGVGPRGRKSVPAGPALRAPTTQSPRSSV